MADTYRPDPEHRWVEDRTEPATIDIRTRFLYSEPNERTKLPAGCTRWAFGRGASVVVGGEWESRYEHMNDVNGYLHRMIAAFGDDADLTITVTRRTV